jgi:hypothetical protein
MVYCAPLSVSASCLLLLVSCLAYSSGRKMEVICSVETLSLIRLIQLYNPEDRTVHSHRSDKSKIIIYFIGRVSEMSTKDLSSRQQSDSFLKHIFIISLMTKNTKYFFQAAP